MSLYWLPVSCLIVIPKWHIITCKLTWQNRFIQSKISVMFTTYLYWNANQKSQKMLDSKVHFCGHYQENILPIFLYFKYDYSGYVKKDYLFQRKWCSAHMICGSSTNDQIYDLSIGSTETKYIKLNTKTQFF